MGNSQGHTWKTAVSEEWKQGIMQHFPIETREKEFDMDDIKYRIMTLFMDIRVNGKILCTGAFIDHTDVEEWEKGFIIYEKYDDEDDESEDSYNDCVGFIRDDSPYHEWYLWFSRCLWDYKVVTKLFATREVGELRKWMPTIKIINPDNEKEYILFHV